MKFKHSIRFRISIAFCIFGTTLCILYGLWMVLGMTNIEDELFEHQLQLEIDHFITNYQNNAIIPETQIPYIKSFLGTGDMTDTERELVKGFGDGIYELRNKDIHIAVKTFPHLGETLYLIYNVAPLEIHGRLQAKRIIYLLVGLILVIAVGVLLGILTSRRISAPIIKLTGYIKSAGIEKLPQDISKQFYSDEVGFLAQTYEQSMQRIEAFIEREKQFTQDASHELRTPITVIKGAAEVLRQRLGKGDPTILRPIQRIEKSAMEMKNTVESFLWLARGDVAIDPEQTSDLASIVKETLEWHRNELEAKKIKLTCNFKSTPIITAPPHITHVCFANLFRNALSFTQSGTITVGIEPDQLEIIDTGEGIPEDQLNQITKPYERGDRSTGFGLGLNIVKRLCDRFGWRLEIESLIGRGTTARWIFKPRT